MNNGGAAFPVSSATSPYAYGMSLRDWFAGQAIVDASLGSANYSPETYLGLARNAYRLADAMLAAREIGE